jgi:glycosyltransferase involved in cell wall biosynthesis
VRYRCRESLAEAAVYAAGLRRQQPRLFEHVDRFVAVSTATAARLEWLGLPAGSSVTLPNFAFEDGVASDSAADRGEYALVSGRLVEEKGFDTAIAAARVAGVPLVVAGDGPDSERLRGLAAGADVRFAGRLESAELARVRARAAVVLVPSRWEEPCPYSVIDALASGVPVLASDRGGLPEMVGSEATIPADDGAAWTHALRELWLDSGLRLERGRAGLLRAREQFGEERYYQDLLGVYSGDGAPTSMLGR